MKSGGRLVYATCSVLPEENEAIAQAFGAAHPDFVALDAGEVLAQLKVDHAASLCTGGSSGSRYVACGRTPTRLMAFLRRCGSAPKVLQ